MTFIPKSLSAKARERANDPKVKRQRAAHEANRKSPPVSLPKLAFLERAKLKRAIPKKSVVAPCPDEGRAHAPQVHDDDED